MDRTAYLAVFLFCIRLVGCSYTAIGTQKVGHTPLTLRPIEATLFHDLMQETRNPEELVLSDGTKLTVHYGDNLFYLIGSGDQEEYCGYGRVAVESKEALVYENRYVKSKTGETLVLEFSSTDPELAPIDEEGTIAFRKPGDLIVAVAVADKAVQIPIRVALIPLNEGMTDEEVIERLGLPDARHEGHVPWLDGTSVDGIYYYASGVYGTLYHHWLYPEFPKAVLRFSLGELRNVVMASWMEGWHGYVAR